MPNYFYTAKSFEGKTEAGALQALDERQLSQQLKAKGFLLIEAISEEEKKKQRKWNADISFGVSLADKILMVRNLGVMFSTGLSLVKSFDILAAQTKGGPLKKALTDIRDRIGRGENLSEAMAIYPKIFSELFINMIKVGEESGTMEEIFQILSTQLTKEHELKSKIKNAMIYPSIILLVMMIVGVIIVTIVLPNLNIFFTSLNAEIPIYTRIMLAIGNFLSAQWYLLIVIPLFLAASVWLILRTKQGKRYFDTLVITVPVLSAVVKKSNSAFLIRSLSSLTGAGVPVTRSLEISSKTVGSHYFKEAAVDAVERVKKGEKLSMALKAHQEIFPVGVVEMVEVGEETGKTSVILKKLADFYEQEAASSVERLAILIEPMLIIVLGLAVGFFAISIIEPMYSSLQVIS